MTEVERILKQVNRPITKCGIWTRGPHIFVGRIHTNDERYQRFTVRKHAKAIADELRDIRLAGLRVETGL